MTTPTKTVDLDRMAAVLREAGFPSHVGWGSSFATGDRWRFLGTPSMHKQQFRADQDWSEIERKILYFTTVRDELIRQGVIEE